MASTALSSDDGNCEILTSKDPIRALYPMVNEDETPLPRSWSSKDKYSFIGLSQNNLRVHYKGCGKTHKDAASVRATHHIPAACGLYYYEVKIVSKGRDGFMGIGLSAQGVNMNRLPGWDKNSYGYHGDDGHSFCSSGTGQSYGPTFTTGDVIGCGINLIDNVCFYTKNGHYLGIAFTDLPNSLYPTVGLQTPGEVVDANFGKSPFVFDINDMMSELRSRVSSTVQNFPVADTYGEWQTMLHKMVSTYLVHHGYCSTAEAFARSTSQDLDEEINSIKNRQKIQKLVLSGRLGEAIRTVTELYSGFLEKNHNLLFMLKVRQFIEMVNGTDSDILSIPGTPVPSQSPYLSPSHSHSKIHSPTPTPSPSSPSCWTNGNKVENSSQVNAVHHTSVIQSTKSAMSNLNQGSTSSTPTMEELNERNAQEFASSVIHSVNSSISNGCLPIINPPPPIATPIDPSAPPNVSSSVTTPTSSNSLSTSSVTSFTSHMNDSDVEMDYVEASTSNNHQSNSVHSQSNGFTNGFSKHNNEDDMDVEGANERKMCGGNPLAIERTLMLGKELQIMSQNLRRDLGKNKQNKTMLQDAFSLLAYNDPWSSPVGWQLDPIQRESVCQALNSAILESHQLPRRPPLEICISHSRQLIKLMSNSGLGSCAFASVDSILNRHYLQMETDLNVEYLEVQQNLHREKLKLLQRESPLIELQDTNSSDFQYSSSSLDLQLNPSSQ